MKVTILGSGMAGLIAGHMLRRFRPMILEAAPALTQNHSALLRFRSDAVSNATSIPFSKVKVRKGVRPHYGDNIAPQASIQDINAYSQKVAGVVAERSIANLDTCERWVAPNNFFDQLAASCPAEIRFGCEWDAAKMAERRVSWKDSGEIIVSTLPLPLLLNLSNAKAEGNKFDFSPITTVVAEIESPETNVFQTVYLPWRDRWGDFYRASIHGNRLILEGMGEGAQIALHPTEPDHEDETIVKSVLTSLFGVSRPVVKNVIRKVQRIGKMVPVEEAFRKRSIYELTENYGIYSLGRFATWRPLLLDDVVQDVKVIERFITSDSSKYFRNLH